MSNIPTEGIYGKLFNMATQGAETWNPDTWDNLDRVALMFYGEMNEFVYSNPVAEAYERAKRFMAARAEYRKEAKT